MGSVSTREQSIARMADVLRDFMANAVLFQDAVARTGGHNSTDLQAVSLLMSQGPATPGELAERTGLSAGGAITAVIDRHDHQLCELRPGLPVPVLPRHRRSGPQRRCPLGRKSRCRGADRRRLRDGHL